MTQHMEKEHGDYYKKFISEKNGKNPFVYNYDKLVAKTGIEVLSASEMLNLPIPEHGRLKNSSYSRSSDREKSDSKEKRKKKLILEGDRKRRGLYLEKSSCGSDFLYSESSANKSSSDNNRTQIQDGLDIESLLKMKQKHTIFKTLG
jgi:hypothetical protein